VCQQTAARLGLFAETGTETHPQLVMLMLPHFGAEFKLASPFVFGGRFRARVAILHSPETRWAFQEQPSTSPGLCS